LLDDGWDVEGLFLDKRRDGDRLKTWRFPLDHQRRGVVRYLVEYSLFFAWTFLWTSWRVLVQRPKLVYVNSPPDLLVFAAVSARLLGIPIVLDEHDPMPELFSAKGRKSLVVHRMLLAQERWAIRFADRVITVHEPLRRLFSERVPGVPIDVVMNVPDLEGWEPVTLDVESRVLVFTGTVAVRYGLDDVIKAVAIVGREIPKIRLRLVGDGEDKDALAQLAADLDVEERIEQVGRVPHQQIPALLAGAWAGVNVPKPDDLGALSFSNKIVECVAMRLPVIASRTETLRTFFPDDSLIYVEPGSPEAIAEGLLRLHHMSETEVEAMLDEASAALEQIAWPKQRSELLRIVSEVVESATGDQTA